MPDFRVPDTAPEDLRLRRAGLAAAGLWATAGGWSMRELTDGWIPDYWVQTWPHGARAAATLVDVGLWVAEDRDGLPGFRNVEWTGQRSAGQIQDERARAAERAARHRARRGESNGARAPVSNTVTNTGTRGALTPNGARESHDSLTLPLTPSGSGGRNGSPPARADSQPAPRIPGRCSDHAHLPADQPVPACGACRDVRLAEQAAADQHDADQRQRVTDEADGRRAAIADCRRCDDQGWADTADGLVRCDHARAEASS